MKLKRQLGVLQVFGIASGAMICSGVFVLPSIAQIAQQRGFERHCMHARNVEELRNVILVSERKRFAHEIQWQEAGVIPLSERLPPEIELE